MKKIIAVLLLFAFTFTSFSALAVQNDLTVYVNGKQVISDTPAVLVGSSTMLPLRAILNALGVSDDEIFWDEKSGSIEVKTQDNYLFLAINNPAAIAHDTMIILETSPYLQNGRTMVPVRFIAEGLNADVQWDAQTRTVLITKE